MDSLKTYTDAALAMLCGERCIGCGRVLRGGGVCPSCLLTLPYTRFRGRRDNPAERFFWHKVRRLERVSASLAFEPSNVVAELLHKIKYERGQHLAVTWGRMLGREHAGYGFFDHADALVPIPLHPIREATRGYNQSLRLAEGISAVTGVPIHPVAIRTRDTVTQTSLNGSERLQNVAGAFALSPEGREQLRQLAARCPDDRPVHVVIIDDVITTGATSINCARAIEQEAGIPVTFSFLALAYAGRYNRGRVYPTDLGLPDLTITDSEYHQGLYPDLA